MPDTMARIICFLLFCASLVATDADQEEEGGKCERIKLPLCQDLGYNWTAMPNLMGHKTQKEAADAMAAYESILTSGCSPHARFLLCSAFAPLCSEQVSGAVSACRALCDAVAADCGAGLRALSGTTAPPPPPPPLHCAAFPARADRRLCMRPPGAPAPPAPAPAPVPRWPFREREDACPPRHARAPSGHCRPACDQDVHYTREQKRAAEAWTTTAAGLALAVTALALAAACAAPARHRYPERAAAWAAACHAAVALAWAARGLVGARPLICAGAVLAQDGLAAPACVGFFAVAYYFTLAADAWVVNAGVAWYLTAASEWSTEALERAAAYLHAGAWGWAGAWTAAALALRRVAADELTGACGVAGGGRGAALTAGPRGAALAAALALALAAAPGLRRLRRALGGRSARRAARLAARHAAAGALHAVLAALALAGPAPQAAAAAAGAGVVHAAWACCRDSCRAWRWPLCPPRKAPALAAPPPPLLLRHHHLYYKRPLHVSRV
ncbi:hypothetical protein ACJJTC_018319 [Scirpophaga incertulas]